MDFATTAALICLIPALIIALLGQVGIVPFNPFGQITLYLGFMGVAFMIAAWGFQHD